MAHSPEEKYKAIKERMLVSLNFEAELLDAYQTTGLPEKNATIYPEYSAQLSALLSSNLNTMQLSSFMSAFNNMEELRASFDSYVETKKEKQALERFYSIEGDRIPVRVRKLGKRFALKMGWLFTGFANLFRKEKKGKEFWSHEIPELALAEHVFMNRFCEDLLPFLDQLLQNREIRIRQFYVLDRELEQFQLLGEEHEGFTETVEQLKEDLEIDRKEIETFFEKESVELEKQFNSLSQIAGTFEFPLRKLKPAKLAKRAKEVTGRLDRVLNEQLMVFFAIGEHWRLKLHNRDLIFKLKDQSQEQGSVLLDLINNELKPAFVNLKKDLNAFATEDVSTWEDRKKVLEIRSFVKQRMPELIQLVFQSKLTSQIDRPVNELEQAIEAGPELHQFAAPVFDGKKISRKSFDPVKTRELLKGSVLSPLKVEFTEERKKFMSLVQKLNTSLEEIQYAANYSVDFYFSQKRDENAPGEFAESLKRSVKKADENLSYLGAMQELITETFSRMTQVFAEQVLQYFEPHRLHQSEKINQRREFISRRKAQIRDFWKQTVKYSIHYFKKGKELYSAWTSKYFNLRNLLGISYEKAPISAELANYLSETKQAIRRLPLMYQKLFENVPLKEERFYIARRIEIQRLNDAFENWKAGRFSPVCVVGEQGSGITTILNFFAKSTAKELSVTRLEVVQNITEEEQLLKLLSKAFPSITFNSVGELIAEIQEMDETRVIVLENIHNLFIRSSGNFRNLHHLFKLISQTNGKVFWLTSCYIYSWKLLDFTNDIAGYFAYVIEFSPMNLEQLRDAILKRHQVSGFSLTYLEPENFAPKKTYQKMSDEDKQLFLKNMFFEELGQYAQSNLSLAFIFWLRAIQKVEDGEIFIQQKRVNFSFLNSLKTPELTTLHAILIHGGLDLNAHSQIFRCSAESSFQKLMVLTDDGLLELRDDIYFINPLVYRMLVSQLKSLNFIY
ncbi:ATP-binding protein [Mangrovibacterium diazotrophicum]|uniref:AAA domain-containing protein n=1 Tax=Mangrovibacterium diazotrophicum TaxID=1261403 RepID=A0A419W7R1_9BACT|nr:ATP-binding protein [Mangrovibacterium diazotrophicum]RKD91499.1 hypothetical protein BC643_1855 [Mangrovibacterium diazotrophicum]